MTWPTFNADLVYDEDSKTVKATGPMLAEYLDREIELMVIGVIQKGGNNDVTGAAFCEVKPGNGSLELSRDPDGNGSWVATLPENVEPRLTLVNGKPKETQTPKKLDPAAAGTFAIAFVKLVKGDDNGGTPGEWYGWLADTARLVPKEDGVAAH
jgi:hypothetical protein